MFYGFHHSERCDTPAYGGYDMRTQKRSLFEHFGYGPAHHTPYQRQFAPPHPRPAEPQFRRPGWDSFYPLHSFTSVQKSPHVPSSGHFGDYSGTQYFRGCAPPGFSRKTAPAAGDSDEEDQTPQEAKPTNQVPALATAFCVGSDLAENQDENARDDSHGDGPLDADYDDDNLLSATRDDANPDDHSSDDDDDDDCGSGDGDSSSDSRDGYPRNDSNDDNSDRDSIGSL